ncbi:hypothetical protein BD779DRAFT_1467977 [Infundibulicybe gibba]|nr:hypothetical protein BD779DRAFT_1467977 [Infundibulicybe gibba]
MNNLRSQIPRIQEDDDTHIPAPSHRYAAPSAPWPWVDLEDEVDPVQLNTPLPPVPPLCDHETCGGCWKVTHSPAFRTGHHAKLGKAELQTSLNSTIGMLPRDFYQSEAPLEVNDDNVPQAWDMIIKSEVSMIVNMIMEQSGMFLPFFRDHKSRVRALFVENMSGPVLQMLGARYNIEPFFFSSSLNWIPSRYQEDVQAGIGDRSSFPLLHHDYNNIFTLRACWKEKPTQQFHRLRQHDSFIQYDEWASNTRTPLALHFGTVKQGQSVYWQSIFKNSPDPTFVLLCYVWHAMYAWDEALEHLYSHICLLFPKNRRIHPHHTQPGHVNPQERGPDFTNELMVRECRNLLNEIGRLEMNLGMQDRRLENVLNLVFSSISIEDSRRAQAATEDSADETNCLPDNDILAGILHCGVYPDLSGLINFKLVFQTVFGMNVREVAPGTNGSLVQYFAVAVPMTIITIWVIRIGFKRSYHHIWKFLCWPIRGRY